MNMCINRTVFSIFLIAITFFLQSCASFNKTITVDQIKDDDTLIAGKFKLQSKETFTKISKKAPAIVNYKGAEISIAIMPFVQKSDIPVRHIGYPGVIRLMSDKEGRFLVPVTPGKYYLVDIHASRTKPKRNWIHQEFTSGFGSPKTLVFTVKPKLINYVGTINVKIQTDYLPKNEILRVANVSVEDNFESLKKELILGESGKRRLVNTLPTIVDVPLIQP